MYAYLVGRTVDNRQTSCVLAQLSENGSQEKLAATGSETNSLFKGGQHWIESLTTIAIPYDGSQNELYQETLQNPLKRLQICFILFNLVPENHLNINFPEIFTLFSPKIEMVQLERIQLTSCLKYLRLSVLMSSNLKIIRTGGKESFLSLPPVSMNTTL